MVLTPTQSEKELAISIQAFEREGMVGAVGFEPTTVRLKVECSTN